MSLRLADGMLVVARSITGLDVCHRKPLIVTCSKDHTVSRVKLKLGQG